MYRLLFKVNSFCEAWWFQVVLVFVAFEFLPSKVGQTNLAVFRLAQN
jgi:hypothetical protein